MIFSAFERMVAMRYLGARRQEGFVSVVVVFSLFGIFLGVGTLIVVMAVMNGFREELMGRILGVNGHLTIFPNSAVIANYPEATDRLSALPGVRLVTPQVQAQAMLTSEGTASGVAVRGMRPADLRARSLIAENLRAGSLEAFAGEDAILMGTRMARRLGRTVGDRVTLLTPQGSETVIGTVPRMKSYEIVGLFEVGMFEYDSTFVYMPLEAAQLLFRLADGVNAIEVFVEDPDLVPRLRSDAVRAAGSGVRSVDWQQANASFFNAIQVERNVMFLILSLIILVAAFNILSGQYMLVKDKGRDIAILRTMGATRGMVLRVFFLSGALVGVVGTVFGCVGGVLFATYIEVIKRSLERLTGAELFAAEIYFLSRLPAEVDPTEVVQVVVMALVISFLAPLFPAWRAARIDPVEALRYE